MCVDSQFLFIGKAPRGSSSSILLRKVAFHALCCLKTGRSPSPDCLSACFFLPEIHRKDPSVPLLTLRNGSCLIRKHTAWILPTVLRNERSGFSPIKKQKEWILSKGAERAFPGPSPAATKSKREGSIPCTA